MREGSLFWDCGDHREARCPGAEMKGVIRRVPEYCLPLQLCLSPALLVLSSGLGPRMEESTRTVGGLMPRRFLITCCIVWAAVAIPSILPAAPAPNVATLERLVGYLSRSIEELRGLASDVRAARGALKEEALVKGRAELSRLKPAFQDARREAERLKREKERETWRGRVDRVYDFVDAYNKIKELDELEIERDQLQAEFCGPRDLYGYAGDC
jgi:hypothetical protein